MRLDRDEFIVTFDPAQASVADLIATIEQAGYTAKLVIGISPPEEQTETDNSSPISKRFSEAFARAEREQKPIVLSFGADWCLSCEEMEQTTFRDPQVTSLLEQTVFLQIDTDEHPQIAQRFEVTSLPAVRFLDRTGTERERLDGYFGPEAMATQLRKFLGENTSPE